ELEVHVVRALARISIRGKRCVASAGDETQRRNRTQLRRARGVREATAAQRHWPRVRIEEFNEIMRGEEPRISQPLVDSHSARIAERHRNIGGAKGRFAKRPGAVRTAADREVGELQAERHRIEQSAARGGFVMEINVVAAGLETESQMNARRTSVVVGVEDQKLA